MPPIARIVDSQRTRLQLQLTSMFIVLSSLLIPRLASAEDELDLSAMRKLEGFVECYASSETGKLWMVPPADNEPLLYVSSLASGLGSNPVGLDRGQFGESRLVQFRRVGQRVYLMQENVNFRSSSTRPAEQRAVGDSFAPSILWAEDLKTTSDGRQVVDLESFLVRDAHGCIQTLASTGQGSYSLDKSRSFVELPRCRAFPDNTELEATLTFSSNNPGSLASRTAADGQSITLRQHHSFVRLPTSGYKPRAWDPRVGAFQVSYTDYSAPIDSPNEIRLLTRHRLEKTNPDQTKSPVKEPIIYYVDSGVPQPVRDALVEGASWWNEAFEAAGFEDAFQVRVLPDDVDPMDVRYNVIQWVHRATRGWSYGQSIVDPRTGEIIKGHVLLGSLRVRQDNRIFQGLAADLANASLAGAGFTSPKAPAALPPRSPAVCDMADNSLNSATAMAQAAGIDSVEVSLARIRQLSAHEVGHTLGFAHNFAASTYGDRASVMDYPAPRVQVVDDQLDFSDAYGVGIGAWDRFSVLYAYGEFTNEAGASEKEKLSGLITAAQKQGLLYISDADARPAGAAHPLANLWDNGENPIVGLKQAARVRELAIKNFGQDAVRVGTALADTEQVFTPIYLHHRYQVEAAAKVIGGATYEYEVRSTDPPKGWQATSLDDQKNALKAILDTIRPESLLIPDETLRLMVPKAYSSADDRERFSKRTSPIFDESEAMRVACDLAIAAILQPQRASRLCQTRHDDWGLDPVLEEIESLLNTGFPPTERALAAQAIAVEVYVQRLIALASSAQASTQARASATARLNLFGRNFREAAFKNPAVFLLLSQEIERFLTRPASPAAQSTAPEAPPGSPIGIR